MNIVSSANAAFVQVRTAIVRLGRDFYRFPAVRADAAALSFSVKSFVAAMLAYYISLRIGLSKPFWSIITVYLVSQTSAGASLGRGVYRLAGTIIGAAATVMIVPNLANTPVICSAALAGWIGLFLYFALLDRTPRAYAFLLAGYTVSLIGFPSVLAPDAVFETASVRVQEISIGILCAVLMHRFVLPKRMTEPFVGKLSGALRNACQAASSALRGISGQSRRERNKLAMDLLGLQGAATHLPYDPVPVTVRTRAWRLIHDRLVRLLPLTAEIEDRLVALDTEGRGLPEELVALRHDVEIWIEGGDAENRRDELALQLTDRARSLRSRLVVEAVTLEDRLVANLALHLTEMIVLLHDCERLERIIRNTGRKPDAASSRCSERARGYVYHRDHVKAARAALGAAVGIFTGCVFWIWSAWPDGGMAVSVLGVCCSLYGTADVPAPSVIKYTVGSVYGVLISLAYSFIVLPRVTDFNVLVMVLAPAFLLGGSLQARLPTMVMAFGLTLTIPILAGLGTVYAGDFAGALNTVIALFASLGFGLMSMTLLQTVPVDRAISRLLRLSRKGVRRQALSKNGDGAGWRSLMVDRAALLLPLLSKSPRSDAIDDPLYLLRVGHAVGKLKQAVRHVDGDIGDEARTLFSALAVCFDAKQRSRSSEVVELEQRTDRLMALVANGSYHDCSQLLDLVIDLRFALSLNFIPHKDHDL